MTTMFLLRVSNCSDLLLLSFKPGGGKTEVPFLTYQSGHGPHVLPTIPQILPVIGYGWHTLSPILNSPAERPFPKRLVPIYFRHFSYLPIFFLSFTLLATTPGSSLSLLHCPPSLPHGPALSGHVHSTLDFPR